MEENRKGLSIAIIVLLVGASVIPNISGNIRGTSKVEDVKDFESEKLQFDKNEVTS